MSLELVATTGCNLDLGEVLPRLLLLCGKFLAVPFLPRLRLLLITLIHADLLISK